MSPHPPRVVPTLTEVLDEGSWQPTPPAASVEPAPGEVDFELDLGFSAAPSAAPTPCRNRWTRWQPACARP
ncbi:hypothetical protein PEC18_02690 [Paucibacter sp. O1-1]|nr:hypothetical protein [Paucibacter sp. O1-1]MDA3824785.1 hypothetical protein [Paucibacter sp. O1-1]